MIVVLIAKILGWLCAHLPESFARGLCALVGDIIYFLPTKRRYLGLSNLHHAFPDKPLDWHKKITREASRRLIEMAMYDLSAPYFSQQRIQQIITVPQETRDEINRLKGAYGGEGGVMQIPHFTLFEALTAVPSFYEGMPELGAIFRPFDNKHLNEFIRQTRARFGVSLFSRKEGFGRALELIRRGGWVGVLFDQNAGRTGALITLFGRTASASDLPGLMSKKFDAPCVVAWMRRTDFWRCSLEVEELQTERTPQAVTLASNRWLEQYLSRDDETCADWLWTHKRWKCQDDWHSRLRLQQKKIWLKESAESAGLSEIPRRTRFWIRLPNWLGDIVMAVPLLRALRESRPDAEITVLAQPHFIELLEKLVIADVYQPLPPKDKAGYYDHFKQYRNAFPDTFLLFTNSLRGDREASLTGCPQRYGMLRPGKKRPLLTHSWNVPEELDESTIHQTLVWEKWLKHFGLNAELNRTPISWNSTASEQPEHTTIGLICGTENDPSKRWPVEHWRTLIEQTLAAYPQITIMLFGTARDTEITAAVANSFPEQQVQDVAGKTSLVGFADALQHCQSIVCNDTGGMHLANLLGTPVIATYGPTNPIRTGPFFDASSTILQPENCPQTGGASLTDLPPARVFEALQVSLNRAE